MVKNEREGSVKLRAHSLFMRPIVLESALDTGFQLVISRQFLRHQIKFLQMQLIIARMLTTTKRAQIFVVGSGELCKYSL